MVIGPVLDLAEAPNPLQLLKVNAAADEADIPRRRFRRLLKEGKGPAVHPDFPAPHQRISRRNLQEWVDQAGDG
jgi:hypothetical protein